MGKAAEDTNDPRLQKFLSLYMKARDRRAANKRAYEEEDAKLKKFLEKIEVELMKLMKEVGSENLKITGLGMAYQTPKTFVTAKDWEAVWAYVEESGNVSLLQRRLSKKAVEEYMEANEGDLPPGVDVSTERVVAVRVA